MQPRISVCFSLVRNDSLDTLLKKGDTIRTHNSKEDQRGFDMGSYSFYRHDLLPVLDTTGMEFLSYPYSYFNASDSHV